MPDISVHSHGLLGPGQSCAQADAGARARGKAHGGRGWPKRPQPGARPAQTPGEGDPTVVEGEERLPAGRA